MVVQLTLLSALGKKKSSMSKRMFCIVTLLEWKHITVCTVPLRSKSRIVGDLLCCSAASCKLNRLRFDLGYPPDPNSFATIATHT